jgi:hypothetical protein
MGAEGALRRIHSGSRSPKDVENKRHGRSNPDSSRHEERTTSDSKAKLDKASLKRAEVEHPVVKMEATRECIASDLRN